MDISEKEDFDLILTAEKEKKIKEAKISMGEKTNVKT